MPEPINKSVVGSGTEAIETPETKAVWSPGTMPLKANVWVPLVGTENSTVVRVNGVKLVNARAC